MSSEPLRLAVVDDHILVRRGFVDLLRDWPHGQVVLEAEDGLDYERRVAEVGHIHVAVVDLAMPRRDGYDTIRWVQRHHPRTGCLAITSDPHPAAVQRALGCGAQGILAKGVRPDELRRALLHVHTHAFYYNELVSRELRRSVQDHQAARPPDALWAALSEREREVMLLYADTQVPDLRAVATRLGITYTTAETHRKNAFKKLGVHHKAELVYLLLTNGWT